MKISPVPAAPFRHLQRLTDNVGVLERAHGIVPRYERGYRVDDVAYGLVVVCRDPSPSAELITLGRRYLYFLARAQAADGKFRSRLGDDRRWRGTPEVQDAWGRSLWALGTAAAHGPTEGIRAEARALFDASARIGSPYLHPMAFAALGAAEMLERWPGDPGALSLLATAGTVIGEPSADAAWPWPAPRLSCSSGCWTVRPGTATCRWCRTRAGAAVTTAPPSTSTRARWRRSPTPACARRPSPATTPG
jgi:hypothetical protein